MATDFTKVDAAEADFDAKMTIFKEKDAALAAAITARDTAASDQAQKEAAVTDAEEVKALADADAEAAKKIYDNELAAVGITASTAPASAMRAAKAKRPYKKRGG